MAQQKKKLHIWNKRALDLMKLARDRQLAKTDKAFCEQIGFLQSNLPGIKTGERSFTIEQLVSIAKLTGVSMDYMCGITNSRLSAGKAVEPLEMIKEGVRMLELKAPAGSKVEALPNYSNKVKK